MRNFTTRKILSGLILLIVGIIITFIKGDIPENLLSLMEWLYSAFVLGNVAQHATEAYGKGKKDE